MGSSWLVVNGWNINFTFPEILGLWLIIPIDELHHFSEGWLKTTKQPEIFEIFGNCLFQRENTPLPLRFWRLPMFSSGVSLQI